MKTNLSFRCLLLIIHITLFVQFSCRSSNNDDNVDSKKEKITQIFSAKSKLEKEYVVNDNGQKDGWYKEYYPQGGIKYLYNYSLNKLNGYQKAFYSNGHIQTLSFCRNSILDSIQEWYYSSGILKTSLFRIDGKRFGLQKQFDSTGKLARSYFISLLCDTCMTCALEFDQDGTVSKKEGSFIYTVISDRKLLKEDTIKIIYYTIIPDLYNYQGEIKIISPDKKEVVETAKFQTLNNNKGILFFKKLNLIGDYKIGCILNLRSPNRESNIDDSTFVNIKVIPN